MKLELDLLKFFQCDHLEALLSRAADAFESAGFPYVILKWEPTPNTNAAMMIANSIIVWSNLDHRLGRDGSELQHALARSVSDQLETDRDDTRACQAWKSAQVSTFKVVDDAPRNFRLTSYQQALICDFGHHIWREFLSHPLCKERDRMLVLQVKTQAPVTSEMASAAEQVFSVFETVYRALHTREMAQGIGKISISGTETLSHREIECLRWLAAGKTLHEAAIILDISERTLRFHITNARERLGVATTMQAVVAAALAYGFNPSDARRSIYAMSRSAMSPPKLRAG